MSKKIGFMQGRLVDSEKKNAIQYFPEKNWEKEFSIGKINKFRIMEWTINYENIDKNPLYNGDLKKVKTMVKKFKILIPSITYDYFMQKPFFKKKNFKIKNVIIKSLKKIIINGNKLGVKYHIFPLVDNASIKSLNEEKVLIKEIRKMLKFLKKRSKILFESDYPPNQIIKFVKKFKSKKIGINYDTGNSSALNYNFNDEIKYFELVKNIHIKDRALNGSTVRLGNGNWDYKKFFKLINHHYKGNFILQTARSKKSNHVEEILLNKKFFEHEYK